MPLPTPPPDAASAAEPAAWAVFDGSGRKWAAYSNIGEAERCAENWNTPRVRKDYGPVQPCHVVPLYTADVPALLSRIARAESALREARDFLREFANDIDDEQAWNMTKRAAEARVIQARIDALLATPGEGEGA